MSDNENRINYSELFRKLLKQDGEMDDTMSSFLYYLFPRDLFIRALSLIDSNNMFIYILDRNCEENLAKAEHFKTIADESSNLTEGDEAGERVSEAAVSDEASAGNDANASSISPKILSEKLDAMIRQFCSDEFSQMYRLIVKTDTVEEPPVYVDIEKWSCSCDEFNDVMLAEINKEPDTDIQSYLIKEIDDLTEFNEDKYGQLDAYSLSKQKYFRTDKVMCAHLLAFSIVTSMDEINLRQFVMEKSKVYMIPINNIDEWLKLHINIV